MQQWLNLLATDHHLQETMFGNTEIVHVGGITATPTLALLPVLNRGLSFSISKCLWKRWAQAFDFP